MHGLILDEASYGYRVYDQGIKFLQTVVEDAKLIKRLKSDDIQKFIDELEAFSQTRPYHLMSGPVYMLLGKLLPKSEHSWKIPASLFKPTMFPLMFLGAILMPYILLVTANA